MLQTIANRITVCICVCKVKQKLQIISMHTDEPLVQLDFDETNRTNHSQPNDGLQHILNHSKTKTNSHSTQRPLSPSLTSETFATKNTASSSTVTSQNRINDSNLLMSTIFVEKTADVQSHSQHHRRAFSDDNKLSSVTHTFAQQNSHSNQYLNVVNDRNKINSDVLIDTEHSNNLIALSRSHSSVIQSEYDHSIENQPTIALNLDEGNTSQTLDDTIEVSLLGDLSMDSRESQPLLGNGRDAHDYVYNNFPGKFKFCLHTFISKLIFSLGLWL